jgi:hypothetical protein
VQFQAHQKNSDLSELLFQIVDYQRHYPITELEARRLDEFILLKNEFPPGIQRHWWFEFITFSRVPDSVSGIGSFSSLPN